MNKKSTACLASVFIAWGTLLNTLPLNEESRRPEGFIQKRATDGEGKAGGASGTREDPIVFKRGVETQIQQWDKKILLLKTASSKGYREAQLTETEKELEYMLGQAKEDFRELDKVEDKAWLDVKSRLEARFQKMNKDYYRVLAE